MKKKPIAGLIAIAAIVAVVIFAGCVEKSSYRVEYSPIAEPFPRLLVNVSGPSDDLAIILTNPEEYTDIAYISKEDLIDNFESVRVRMCKSGNPPVGTYKLAIKTITPEKVVYEAEEKFTPAVISITNAEITLKWFGGVASCYRLVGYDITVKNEGELPVIIDYVLISISDDEIREYKHRGMSHGENKIEERSEGGGLSGYLSREITPMSLATIELYSEGNEVANFKAEITIEY